MKAIVSSSGGPVFNDAFEDPVAGPGQVLVRIKAAALNRADLAMLTGATHGFAGGMGMPLGLEWSGEVVDVGSGVDHLRQGDRVMGAGPGAFAEYTVTNARWVYPVPDALSIEHAAALPVSLQTMHDAIVSNGLLKSGQTVLIQGAASAMGLMGLQIARLMGAGKVIGTSTSAQRREQLSSFGADVAIDTRSDDWVKQVLKATKMKGVDLAVDLLAGPYVNDTLKATRVGGRAVNVGRMAGEHTDLDLDQHSMRRITYVGVTFRTRTPLEISEVIANATADLMPALADGRIRMPVDRVYRFDQVREAFDHMAANRHFGKIVLSW